MEKIQQSSHAICNAVQRKNLRGSTVPSSFTEVSCLQLYCICSSYFWTSPRLCRHIHLHCFLLLVCFVWNFTPVVEEFAKVMPSFVESSHVSDLWLLTILAQDKLFHIYFSVLDFWFWEISRISKFSILIIYLVITRETLEFEKTRTFNFFYCS